MIFSQVLISCEPAYINQIWLEHIFIDDFLKLRVHNVNNALKTKSVHMYCTCMYDNKYNLVQWLWHFLTL